MLSITDISVRIAGRLLIDDEDENWWVTSVTEGIAPGAWRLM